MTTSSQTPPGAPPSEAPRPLPLHAAAFATFGVAVPAPAGSAETAPPAPAPTVTEAAAAVLDARIAQDRGATTEQLAEAEARAGILFDPAGVEDAVSAAVAQARSEARAELDEVRAELREARAQLGAMAGDHRRAQAVLRLCEGRRGDDLLLVSAVATAAESGHTAMDGLPMTLTWDRTADVLRSYGDVRRVTVHCQSSYGGRADLIVRGEDRTALASLLDAQLVGDIHAPCGTDGCGTRDDYDASDPALFGWARLEVAGTDDGPRWYCSPRCVAGALARAGEELAAIEQQAESLVLVDQDERPAEHDDEVAVPDER
ncbi:hypothetical protein [Streptomyces sp.]|uniref:hypothetical protein n=1 Tax=Streptomyces sp. TaxID=1931 RepID=UPI002811F5C4|nr:hypothetical protein [Streptomyces sp.]